MIWKNRVFLLCYIKLWATFQSHCWIQTGVTVRKRQIWIKISNSLSPLNLTFDGWPWKTIGHLFCAISSFVHLFVAISEFKWSYSPEIQNSGKNCRFFSCKWPWNLMKENLFYATSSFVHNFIAISEIKLELQSGNTQLGSKSVFFVPRDLEILWMTL